MNGKNGYQKFTWKGCTVHTYELSNSQHKLIRTVGIPNKLEKLSDIYKSVPGAVAAVNLGYFEQGSKDNPYVVEEIGKWQDYTTTVTLGNDGVLRLLDSEELSPEKEKEIENTSQWVAGAGYTLVENGVKSIKHTEKFPHYKSRTSRTMIGQLNDNYNSLILVVVQGGGCISNFGLTANQQADLMLYLKCKTAVNLDGGGSSEMIVENKIMNKPTDGRERSIGSALVVVKKNTLEIIGPQLKFRGAFEKNTPKNIIIHHALAKTCSIQDIHRWHLDNGWSGCGYHYFINKKGEIFKGRPDTAAGAHTKEQSMNYNSIGICLEGCYEDYGTQTDKEVPQIQLDSLIALTKHLKAQYGISNVYSHNYFANYKKCPGNYFPWDKFIKQI